MISKSIQDALCYSPYMTTNPETIDMRVLQVIDCAQDFMNTATVAKLHVNTFAKYGVLESCKWARKNGCSWNKWTCAEAAKYGHLHVLQWLRDPARSADGKQNNTACPWNVLTCANTALNGYLHVLQWAWDPTNSADGTVSPWDAGTCAAAAGNGHLHVLQWVRDPANSADGTVCPWDKWTCQRVALKGHLDVLQWLRSNGCPWTSLGSDTQRTAPTERYAPGTTRLVVSQLRTDISTAQANGCSEWKQTVKTKTVKTK